MAILIVDDESSTRSALRELMTQIGHKVILEAKNGVEALKMAETEKNRLRMIVADWEMPYMDGIQLLHRVAEMPELDQIPFLLITSDLSRTRLAELQEKTNRLDAFLIKPFRMTALSQAMTAAQAHRASIKRSIIVFDANADSTPSFPTFEGWDAPLLTRTLPEFQQAIQAQSRHLGALIIQPPASPELAQWLTTFARTPMGSATPLICASREPEAIFPLRTLCQVFVAKTADQDLWAKLLQELRARMANSLTLELLFQELKTSQQKKDTAEAQRICMLILATDAANSEANAILGDLLEAQQKGTEAATHYFRALEANPCQPRPYIRLLESSTLDPKARLNAATQAALYCPQNQDILLSAARAFKEAGELEQARELVGRILKLNPKNAGALALLPNETS